MAHVTQTFEQVKPHKHSVRFDMAGDGMPLFSGLYLNREAAKKFLKVKDLDKVEEIEITVRIKE